MNITLCSRVPGSLRRPCCPHWFVLVSVLLVSSVACESGSSVRQPPGSPAEVLTASDGTRYSVETVASGLDVPWALAFAPDGRIFVSERPGRVRIIQNNQILEQPALILSNVYARGEAGLLGLALHPDFGRNHFVYLAYTEERAGELPVNRLVRYREANNALVEPFVLVDNIRAANIHDGARVKFGPDGLLYMTMGDVADAPTAQDTSTLNGKILRLGEEGSVPPGNPFSSPVFSYGHRNPQGIDWDPVTQALWATEHGQSANDEVNLVEAGANYGWPEIEGAQTREGMRTPVIYFEQTAAPSGAAFCWSNRIPAFNGDLFFAALRGEHLHRVRLDPADRRRVLGHEALVSGRYGRLRDVVLGPDGLMYFCTNNRDGRGSPGPDDDRILRIVPAAERARPR